MPHAHVSVHWLIPRPVRTGDLDLEILAKPIPRKLGFLSAILPLSESIDLLSNVVVVKVRSGTHAYPR